MSALQRAEHYAAIFLNVGHKWPYYVPLDATVSGDVVYLQGIQMRPVRDDAWELSTNGQAYVVQLRTEATS